jgi:sporulation protein YlmC with PRC-barrel domain
MATRLLLTIAGIAVMACSALAQEPPPSGEDAQPPAESTAPVPPEQAAPESDLRKVKDDDRMIDAWNLKVDQVEDMDVYGPDGKEVGEIEKVLEDSDGQIRAVVVEFGGFLGFGDTEVIVPLDQLQPGKKHFTTKLTQEQLSAFPAWKK